MHAQFVYLHVTCYLHVKVRRCESPKTIEFAGNSSLVNPPKCTQSLGLNFTDDITAGKKIKTRHFLRLADSKKLKNCSVGRWTQMKDISNASPNNFRIS